MALGFLEIFLILIFTFVIVCFLRCDHKNDELPKNWPLVGSLPDFIAHIDRIHDRLTDVLEASGCTFVYRGRGPFFTNMSLLVTADPANVHYIMSQNFANFPKGVKFRKIFDVLGDGIFNSDHESWRDQRKVAQAMLNHSRFLQFSHEINRKKLRTGLLPILDRSCAQGHAVDLQDLLQRFTFDTTSVLVSGYDPKSLAPDLPESPYMKALDDVEEALFYRHVIPKSLLALQRRLNIGLERKYKEAWETLDNIMAGYISKKRQEMMSHTDHDVQDRDLDMLTSYMRSGQNDDKFLRDAILNLMTAGRDTTSATLSWFFYLVSTNPHVKNKIRDEITSIDHVHDVSELNKVVYLHAALCETLRLYPPVPFQHKAPLRPDILPSGHRVDPESTMIVMCMYAMGRMRSIWGDDCLEMKPERWISERGRIKHVPSYKFMAFNAGPRTCIGKELGFTQMKMVAAAVLREYDIEVVEGHAVVPDLSIILHMKHGLMVKLTKRSHEA